MRKTIGFYLFLGLLSMLYAEIFSGASQLWYLSAWGWLYTLPLYLLHTMFFFYLALRTRRASMTQLYLYGMLFALYEALITKVLWAGYINETGPGFGTFLGLASVEFSILVFFWHPIFSFILPVLTYEIISGKHIDSHQNILKKTKTKQIILLLVLFTIAGFIAQGNQYDFVSINLAYLGTLALLIIVGALIKFRFEPLSKIASMNIILVVALLVGIYGFGIIFLMPERFPTTVMPYISVLFFYCITIFMLYLSKPKDIMFQSNESSSYQVKDVWIGVTILWVFVNFMALFQSFAQVLLFISYLFYAALGIVLLIYVSYSLFKKR